jgi:hypothetical protein
VRAWLKAANASHDTLCTEDGVPGGEAPPGRGLWAAPPEETRNAPWSAHPVRVRGPTRRQPGHPATPRYRGRGVRGAKPLRAGSGGCAPRENPKRPLVRAFRGQGAPRVWRCRESNPGPPSLREGFSVRSPLCLYSDPPVTRTSRCDDPSRCLMSPPAPRPGERVSPLADAGTRVGNAPGPTVPHWIRRRVRTRPEPGQCAY